jgi:hypothetical protein
MACSEPVALDSILSALESTCLLRIKR